MFLHLIFNKQLNKYCFIIIDSIDFYDANNFSINHFKLKQNVDLNIINLIIKNKKYIIDFYQDDDLLYIEENIANNILYLLHCIDLINNPFFEKNINNNNKILNIAYHQFYNFQIKINTDISFVVNNKEISFLDFLNLDLNEFKFNFLKSNDLFLNFINFFKSINQDVEILILKKELENVFLDEIEILNFLSFSKLNNNNLNLIDVVKINIFDFITSFQQKTKKLIDEPNINTSNNDLSLIKQELISLCLDNKTEEIINIYSNHPTEINQLINYNIEGDNLLCIASYKGNLDLIKFLISVGWNINFFDFNLNNALIISCAEGNKHIVEYLLDNNAKVDFQNKKGYSALHFSINDCNHRITKLLIEHKANINAVDNDKNTPLSIAAFKGDLSSAKLLLDHNVNIHLKNKKGYDARAIAIITRNFSISDLIEDKIKTAKAFNPLEFLKDNK